MLDRFTWFRQAAFRYADDHLVVYIDPWGTSPDDPRANLIFLTHAHHDHFQPHEIERLADNGTAIVAPKDVADGLTGSVTAVGPGESHEIEGVRFETVPAYNIVEERLDMHPQRNNWVGYVLELGGHTYYHAGDTDALPELKTLTTDVAMVPIGGTYTMDYREAAGLVKTMKPMLAVPMHFGFVVCSPSHSALFKREAAPIPVEILQPTNDFEQP